MGKHGSLRISWSSNSWVVDQGTPTEKLLTYLGDVLNDKGNNQDLISDSVKRGIQEFVVVEAFMRETSFGNHTVSIYRLLYKVVLILPIVFNCQDIISFVPEICEYN